MYTFNREEYNKRMEWYLDEERDSVCLSTGDFILFRQEENG